MGVVVCNKSQKSQSVLQIVLTDSSFPSDEFRHSRNVRVHYGVIL